jgi:hypothetical protein
MRKSLLLLCLLIVLIACFYAAAGGVSSDTRPAPTDATKIRPFDPVNTKKQKLVGPVKSVRVAELIVEEKSGKAVEGPRRLSGLMQYDPKGNLTELEDGGSFGNAGTKLLYSYDASGKLTQVQEWEYSGSKAAKPLFRPLYKHTYEYDNKGNLAEESIYLEDALDSTVSYTCNAEGKTTESIMYKPGKKPYCRVTCVYDSKGNLVEDVLDRIDGKFYKNQLTYDSSGERTGSRTYNRDGSLRARVVESADGKRRKSITYNGDGKLSNTTIRERGNVISEEDYNSDGSLRSKLACTYEYDKTGNFTKATWCDQKYESGKPQDKRTVTSYRTIVYYD